MAPEISKKYLNADILIMVANMARGKILIAQKID